MTETETYPITHIPLFDNDQTPHFQLHTGHPRIKAAFQSPLQLSVVSWVGTGNDVIRGRVEGQFLESSLKIVCGYPLPLFFVLSFFLMLGMQL